MEGRGPCARRSGTSRRMATLRTWFQNAEALARRGVPKGAPTSAAVHQDLRTDRGMQMWQQGQTLVRLGQNMANLADASDGDMMARLKSMKPDPADQSTYAVKSAAYSISRVPSRRRRTLVSVSLSVGPCCTTHRA